MKGSRILADKAGSYRLGTILTSGIYALVAFSIPPLVFPTPSPDFLDGYHPGAVSLQRGEGYMGSSGDLITHWPPGFSLILSPVASESPETTFHRARYLSAMMAAVLVFVMAGLVNRVFPDASTGFRLSVVWLATLWPPMMSLPNPAGSELSFALAVAVGVGCLALATSSRSEPQLLRAIGWAGLGGFAIGVATLIKTLGVAVLGAVLVAIVFAFHAERTGRAAMAVVFFIACAAPLVPWVRVVKNATGEAALSTAGVASIQDGLGRFKHREAGRFLDSRRSTWKTTGDIAADLVVACRRYPASMAQLMAEKLVRPWYATNSGRLQVPLVVFNLPWLMGFLIVSARTVKHWSRIPGIVTAIIGIVGACWLSSVIVLSIYRYLAPVFPLLVVAVMWHVRDFQSVQRGALAQ